MPCPRRPWAPPPTCFLARLCSSSTVSLVHLARACSLPARSQRHPRPAPPAPPTLIALPPYTTPCPPPLPAPALSPAAGAVQGVRACRAEACAGCGECGHDQGEGEGQQVAHGPEYVPVAGTAPVKGCMQIRAGQAEGPGMRHEAASLHSRREGSCLAGWPQPAEAGCGWPGRAGGEGEEREWGRAAASGGLAFLQGRSLLVQPSASHGTLLQAAAMLQHEGDGGQNCAQSSGWQAVCGCPHHPSQKEEG